MPVTTSRKMASAKGKRSRPSKPALGDIARFTRVSKAKDNRKELNDKVSRVKPTVSIEVCLPSSRKRKVDTDFDANSTSLASCTKKLRREAASTPLTEITNSSQKRQAKTSVPCDLPSKAQSSKRKRQSETPNPEPVETSDASQAEFLLERLNLQVSPVRKRTKTNTSSARQDWPFELVDLVNLHVAFLKTLNVHYAHNGTTAPVDIRTLCPSIAQAWGKRAVTVEDIRLCIGILGWTREAGASATQVPFLLSDYGHGKLCLEQRPDAALGYLHEHQHSATFRDNLRDMWSAYEDSDVQRFLASLPMAGIIAGMSATKISPLLAKGQRALNEIKESMAKKQQEKIEKTKPASVTKTDGSKMTLLERIRQKEILQAHAPSGPSPAELQRHAALERAPEITAVISMLVRATAMVGQARVSYTMPAILVKLKDSLRLPVSDEEAVCCIKLLANEVTPQWLRVVTIGGRDNVVIQTGYQPKSSEVEESVKMLLSGSNAVA